jgi:hypothetical protein
MVGIRPIFTSHGKAESSHLCISLVELAATTRRNVVGSLVDQLTIYLGLYLLLVSELVVFHSLVYNLMI